MTTYRIGLDIGGTFTDFVLYDAANGQISLHKCLTTPADPSVAALEGLAELTAAAGIGLEDVAEILHGTTLVTNAIIERKSTPLGLLTTRGFRDVLEMGTEQRYDIYDLFLGFPQPLVAAPPPAGDRRARGSRRQRRRAARSRRNQDGGAAAGGARHRSGRDLLPAFLLQPGARTRGARPDRARVSQAFSYRSRPRWWPSCASISAR